MKPAYFILTVFLLAACAAIAQPPSDEYLKGYLTAILLREAKLAPDSFSVEVSGGAALVRLHQADEAARSRTEELLSGVEGLSSLQVSLDNAPKPESLPARAVYTVREALGLSPEGTSFPAGDVFRPLVADVKQPQFFVSFRHFDALSRSEDPEFGSFTMASVAYGGVFGLYRRLGKQPGDGLQISMDGALFAQFNVDAPSKDLLNADYTVGIPVSYRENGFSARLRFYHQSSHLGDEFLLSYAPERVNLSYEAFQLTLSQEIGDWRLYGGGEYLVDREPSDLKPGVLQGGIEFRSEDWKLLGGYPIAGLDVKSYGETHWTPSYSLKAGIQFGAPDANRRHLRLLLEAYRGFAPYGQFYQEKVEFFGLGFAFNF